jgi:hypothetical protein
MYPLEPGDAEAALTAAMDAAGQYQSHYQDLISGLGSPGGDPLQAESAEQPEIAGQVSVT